MSVSENYLRSVRDDVPLVPTRRGFVAALVAFSPLTMIPCLRHGVDDKPFVPEAVVNSSHVTTCESDTCSLCIMAKAQVYICSVMLSNPWIKLVEYQSSRLVTALRALALRLNIAC